MYVFFKKGYYEDILQGQLEGVSLDMGTCEIFLSFFKKIVGSANAMIL